MKLHSCRFFLCFFLCLSISALAKETKCVLKMAYKNGGKPPLIFASPNNQGVYLKLFEQAANKIGCRLKVLRMSKRRLHQQLRKGSVDFYPNGSFSPSRAEYVNYIDMGLMSGEFGLTEVSFLGDIGHYQELRQQNLIWLMEKGGSKKELADKFKVKTQRLKYVDIDIARIEFIKGASHFYVVDNEVIDYYLYQKKVESLAGLGLKLHRDCCGGERPMYTLFSRNSAYYQSEKNPDFDDSKPLGPTNQPTRPAYGSVAAKLANVLREMSESGESDKIYRSNYFP